MKTNQKLIIVLAVMLAMALISPAAWAKKDQPPPPTPPCGLTGTWMGDAEGDLAWLAIHTSTDGLKGEMLMSWVHNDLISPTDEMAPGHGVWELIDSDTGTYSYTWYSQMKLLDPASINEPQIFPIRVYGMAEMQGCDDVLIYFTFETHKGEYDQSGQPVWVFFDDGQASETRIKVYSPELQ